MITRRSLFAVLAGGAVVAKTLPAMAVAAPHDEIEWPRYYEVDREYLAVLKSGGPVMSIGMLRSDGYVLCSWFGDDHWQYNHWFHRACLRGCP